MQGHPRICPESAPALSLIVAAGLLSKHSGCMNYIASMLISGHVSYVNGLGLGGLYSGFHIGCFEKGGKSSDSPHLPVNSAYYQCFDN